MDKTQEIRKALESATPGKLHKFHGNIALTSDDIIGSLTVATAYYTNFAELFANSKEWLSYLLTELDAANEWISIQNETITTLNTDNGSLQQQLDTAKRENERLQSDLVKVESGNIRFWKENMSLQQRLKQAIEALEHYANEQNWYRNPFGQWEYVFDSNSWEPAEKTLSLIREGESHGTETR